MVIQNLTFFDNHKVSKGYIFVEALCYLYNANYLYLDCCVDIICLNWAYFYSIISLVERTINKPKEAPIHSEWRKWTWSERVHLLKIIVDIASMLSHRILGTQIVEP